MSRLKKVRVAPITLTAAAQFQTTVDEFNRAGAALDKKRASLGIVGSEYKEHTVCLVVSMQGYVDMEDEDGDNGQGVGQIFDELEGLFSEDFAPVRRPSEDFAPVHQSSSSTQGRLRPLSVKQVFDLLYSRYHKQNASFPDIPVHKTASPIYPGTPLFFVAGKDDSAMPKGAEHGDIDAGIGVKYQSFSNGEVWWNEAHGRTHGLVARTMSRTVRNSANEGEAASHGYSGKWYSLLFRPDASQEVTRKEIRFFVVRDATSLVQIVPTSKHIRRRRKRQKPDSSSSKSSYSESRGGDDEESYYSNSTASTDRVRLMKGTGSVLGGLIQARFSSEDENAPPEGVTINGNTVCLGELTVNKLNVLNNATVDGRIQGKLITGEGAADYAEWFEKLNLDEPIVPGDVVQLYSPGQKVSKNTSGSGPLFVVSTSPSVAAGVPEDRAHKGVMCGFLGQVPINVHGPVEVGDQLVVSGQNDGRAVVLDKLQANGKAPLSSAMESCPHGEHQVLSLVYWQNTTPSASSCAVEEDAERDFWTFKVRVPVTMILGAWLLSFYFHGPDGLFTPSLVKQFTYHPRLLSVREMAILVGSDALIAIWYALHFPFYLEYIWEAPVHCIIGLAKIVALGWMLLTALLKLERRGTSESDDLMCEFLECGLLVWMMFLTFGEIQCAIQMPPLLMKRHLGEFQRAGLKVPSALKKGGLFGTRGFRWCWYARSLPIQSSWSQRKANLYALVLGRSQSKTV